MILCWRTQDLGVQSKHQGRFDCIYKDISWNIDGLLLLRKTELKRDNHFLLLHLIEQVANSLVRPFHEDRTLSMICITEVHQMSSLRSPVNESTCSPHAEGTYLTHFLKCSYKPDQKRKTIQALAFLLREVLHPQHQKPQLITGKISWFLVIKNSVPFRLQNLQQWLLTGDSALQTWFLEIQFLIITGIS